MQCSAVHWLGGWGVGWGWGRYLVWGAQRATGAANPQHWHLAEWQLAGRLHGVELRPPRVVLPDVLELQPGVRQAEADRVALEVAAAVEQLELHHPGWPPPRLVSPRRGDRAGVTVSLPVGLPVAAANPFASVGA